MTHAYRTELAWTHILSILESAQMSVKDLVKVTPCLLRAEDIPACVKVRSRFMPTLCTRGPTYKLTA